jgi:hypothetical protein
VLSVEHKIGMARSAPLAPGQWVDSFIRCNVPSRSGEHPATYRIATTVFIPFARAELRPAGNRAVLNPPCVLPVRDVGAAAMMRAEPRRAGAQCENRRIRTSLRHCRTCNRATLNGQPGVRASSAAPSDRVRP